MPKTIFDPAARAALAGRIDRLAATTPARWGKFTAPRMVAHLIESVRMALGDVTVRPRPSVLSNRVMRYLVIYLMPWPKGTPTAPELLARAPDAWPLDIAALKSNIDRAAANGPRGAWQPHPAFGDISPVDWGVLIHKHVHHHLTQFGV